LYLFIYYETVWTFKSKSTLQNWLIRWGLHPLIYYDMCLFTIFTKSIHNMRFVITYIYHETIWTFKSKSTLQNRLVRWSFHSLIYYEMYLFTVFTKSVHKIRFAITCIYYKTVWTFKSKSTLQNRIIRWDLPSFIYYEMYLFTASMK